MHRVAPLVVLLVAFTACHKHEEEHVELLKLRVTNPLRKTTEMSKSFVAQIRAVQHIELRPLEEGYVQTIFVDEGQQVRKGTQLFQILPLIYQAEVQKAEAEADLTDIEYKNTKALADKNVVSANELAIARARANRAKAQVNLATTRRSMTEIRAPFDGLVGRFKVRKGSLVDEEDLLTTLSDNSKMWVYFNVSEAEYINYKGRPEAERKAPVKLVMANGAMFDELGLIETIEADFNNATGSVAFRAGFNNPNSLLRHGETGRILMTVPLPNALLIPQLATFDVLEKKFVFVLDKDNTVRSRLITVATELPQVFSVASGLDEHDTVLIDGLRRVREGMKIEPDFVKPAEVLSGLEVPAE